MVYITPMHGDKAGPPEGLCLPCANELGIKPVNDILKNMGVDEEQIQSMSDEIDSLLESQLGLTPSDEEDDDGKMPTLNFGEIFGMMNGSAGGEGKGAPKNKKPGKNDQEKYKALSTYCTNLNEKAKSGKVDRLVGRERELQRIIQILSRRQKNNPCLIGEPGVGKTAIAEELASRIVEGKVPESLIDYEVWMLDLTALVAGTQFRGQFESRVLSLLKDIKAAGNVILMIDEVHNISGAGETSDGSMSAANLLKPALSRGEIRVIGATTLKEYRKSIEKDSALERRFQPVKIDEPSVEETVEIIKGIKKYYESFHGVYISDEVARFAATLSERYITERFLPDKAIDLIDEASAKLALSSPEVNEQIRNKKRLDVINKEMARLESEISDPEKQNEKSYEEIASL